MILPMHQIRKPVLNTTIGPSSFIERIQRTRFCCAQSIIRDKAIERVTSYLYVFK